MATRSTNHNGGFTVIEMLVTMMIVAVLLALAVPMFQDFMDRGRLVSAADSLVADLQLARTEAIRNNQNVMVSFQSGNGWCYGLIVSGTACNCSVTGAASAGYCSLKRVASTDFNSVTIPNASAITFASNQTGFDPVRGTALNAGEVTLESTGGRQAKVSLALLGRVGLCAPASSNITSYPTC